MNYIWTPLNHPTKFPVYENKAIVIPSGTPGVEIAYGQSSKPLLNKQGYPTGKNAKCLQVERTNLQCMKFRV